MNNQSIFSAASVPNRTDWEQSVPHFATSHIKVQHPTKGIVPFYFSHVGVTLLDAFQTRPRVIVYAPRQIGKTTTSIVYLMWHALFKDNQTVVVSSPTQQHTTEVLDRIRFSYEHLPPFLPDGSDRPIPKIVRNIKTEMQFDNGSRILVRPVTSHAIRGYTVDALYIDDFAYANPKKLEEFWISAMPSIAAGGRTILVSTPSNQACPLNTLLTDKDWFPIVIPGV